jgi:hypothetical protein
MSYRSTQALHRVRVAANFTSENVDLTPVNWNDQAIATATRDQHIRQNALLQPKHNWRSAVSNYTALCDIAASIPHPSILQRFANRQLFVLDHSRRSQRWQPCSRHLRDPSHWSEQEDQALRRLGESPEAGAGSRAPLESPGGRGPRTLGVLQQEPHTSPDTRRAARARQRLDDSGAPVKELGRSSQAVVDVHQGSQQMYDQRG